MISSNDLKPGLTILVDGEIYTVLEASQNKTARSAMVVKAKVRNIRTGSNVELSWGGGEKVEPAQIEKREMQYLYDTDDAMVFMDNETYDQVEIPMDRLKWERNFIVPNNPDDPYDVMNLLHNRWLHPSDASFVSTESFFDLYDRAQLLAMEAIRLFLAACQNPDLDKDLLLLIKNRNYNLGVSNQDKMTNFDLIYEN